MGLTVRVDVLVRVSIALTRLHDRSNSFKGKILTGASLLVHYYHDGIMAASRETACQSRKPIILNLDWQTAGRETATGPSFENPKPTSIDTLPPARTHLLPEGYSSK